MNKKNIFISGLSALIILSFIVIIFYVFSVAQNKYNLKNISVLTDKGEYEIGEELKVKIKNSTDETLCFSSCYPYYIERKDGVWDRYRYQNCPKENITDKCVDPHEVKAFELTIPELIRGNHRLSIGACINCGLNEIFKADKNLISNQFIIK